MVERVWKQPLEKRLFTYDFTELLATNTIAAILSVDSASRTGATTLINVAQNNSDSVVQVTWGGGDNGIAYRTTVRVRDNTNQEHELEGEIFVSDVTFVLPIGITSTYLSGEEYVDRFGYEETVRLTDELRRGTIDGPTIMAAIADAQQFADGYLATRYDLPIAAPIPSMLKAIVADLARERLHTTRPTPQVTANADRARKLLLDLSAGRALLPVETGGTVEVGSGGSPAWTYGMDPAVFNAEKLAGY